MTARDLRSMPPRRWNERAGGIYWLPRLTDKARAALTGALGDYLYGQSPIDRGLLRVLRLNHRTFAEIVRDAPDDDVVVARIAARDAGALERARAWSDRFPQRQRLFLWILDVDDGYRSSRLYSLIAVAARAISRAVKRLRPWRP